MAYANLATCYLMQNNIEKALENVDKSISLNEFFPNALRKKLKICDQAGRYDDVLQVSSKLLELVPKDSYTYYIRGLAFLRKGNLKESLTCLKKSLDFNPNYKPAKRTLNNLMNLITKTKNEKELPK
jgi:tetratricopeptide (TPR) repeat protein